MRSFPTARHSVPCLALVVASLAAAAPVAAQVPVPARAITDSVPLTLGEAVARAVRQSQEVRLARSQVELADAQVTSARAAALPQIDANLAYTRTFASAFAGGGFTLPDSLRFEPDTTLPLDERVRYLERNAGVAGLSGIASLFGDLPFGQENAYVASISGSQPLYSGGRVGAALRIADEYRQAARFGLQEELAEIELQVRNAYYQALLGQEIASIAHAAVEQAQAFLDQEQLRLSTGSASELEVLRADVELENLRPQLVEAVNLAELALLNLKRLIDLSLAQPVSLTTPLTVPSAADLAAASVSSELLQAQRASVRAAERQVAIREQLVRIARGAYLPSVDLSMAYGKQLFPAGMFDFGSQDWRTDWTATLGVSIPIFSGFRRKAEVDRAQVELLQDELRLAQLREAVQLEYEQARGEKERAAATIAARERTVGQAQRVHDLTVLRYEQGLATQLEVSDARLALLQSRTNLAQALSDFYTADASLTRAVGVPSTDAAIQPPAVPQSQQTPPAVPPTAAPPNG